MYRPRRWWLYRYEHWFLLYRYELHIIYELKLWDQHTTSITGLQKSFVAHIYTFTCVCVYPAHRINLIAQGINVGGVSLVSGTRRFFSGFRVHSQTHRKRILISSANQPTLLSRNSGPDPFPLHSLASGSVGFRVFINHQMSVSNGSPENALLP